MHDRGEMVSAILEDLFDDTLLNQTYEKLTEGKVKEGMENLIQGLKIRRQNCSDQEWAEIVSMCMHHPIKGLLHQDPFTHRAFTKPRGFAGDAVLIDFIYGREEHWPLPEGTTDLGREIFDYTTSNPAPEGVRERRDFIANLLDRLVEEHDRPHVLSIAAGHLREVMLSSAVRRRKFGRFLALDSDTESLEEVDRSYSRYGVEVMAATIRLLLSNKTGLGEFDLVYSTGLFDYLQQTTAQRLTSVMFDMLRPRGQLLVANFLPGIADIGYMESFMDWKLIYRTRHEMLEVSANIPQAEIRDIRIFTEENQNIIFLQITKR
jgi:extracellular factor (EF) 3-hydroxypalmitic acid methyl ester biosynthesis protein